MHTHFQLHHVGIVVKDIGAAAERYERRLGYEQRSGVIHDPLQTAQVQFLGLPAAPVYLELVSPDGPGSKLQDALAKGESLHHLCYLTETIEVGCEHLRNEGMTLVRAPAPAVAFRGRRIAWMMGRDRVLIELLERGPSDEL